MKVSYYKDAYDSSGKEVHLESILEQIQEGKWRDRCIAIQNSSGKQRDELKAKLPSFITAGVFEPNRKIQNYRDFTGLIILDIDPFITIDKKKVPQYQVVSEVFNSVINDKYTKWAFRSPSGKGIKIIIEIGNIYETVDDEVVSVNNLEQVKENAIDVYYSAFSDIEQYYIKNYGLVLDRSGKNINRICYVSYDPLLFYNKYSEKFNPILRKTTQTKIVKIPDTEEDADLFFKMNLAIEFNNRRKEYSEGNRNNYIYALCCILNRFGVDFVDTLELIELWYGLPAKDRSSEWFLSARSAYSNKHQHGIKKVTTKRVIYDENGNKSLRS